MNAQAHLIPLNERVNILNPSVSDIFKWCPQDTKRTASKGFNFETSVQLERYKHFMLHVKSIIIPRLRLSSRVFHTGFVDYRTILHIFIQL